MNKFMSAIGGSASGGKKILFSVSGIVAVAAIVVASTGAFFSNTETSRGNVFTAGKVDLKVDHTRQTYNGVDCQTCDVDVYSNADTQAVATSGGADPVAYPHAAVVVSNPNARWTASIPPAQWVWSTDPTLQADTVTDITYTFSKTFQWMGPVDGATLNLGVGADNSYEVYLNGHLVGGDNTEFNYQAGGQDTYSGTQVSPYIVQGTNTLRFVVKNWAQVNGNPETNPGGLLYRLHIDGNCQDDYFRTHCTLFSEKDLGPNDHFWMFDDVKPGDFGTNVISLHPLGNDAYACLFSNNLVDEENDLLPVETLAGDTGSPVGELSSFLKLFAWADDGDGVYEAGEATLVPANTPINTEAVQLALSTSGVTNVGIAWCAGEQSVVDTTISCDGSGENNIAQTDSSTLDMTAYAVQQRHNQPLDCSAIASSYRNANR